MSYAVRRRCTDHSCYCMHLNMYDLVCKVAHAFLYDIQIEDENMLTSSKCLNHALVKLMNGFRTDLEDNKPFAFVQLALNAAFHTIHTTDHKIDTVDHLELFSIG